MSTCRKYFQRDCPYSRHKEYTFPTRNLLILLRTFDIMRGEETETYALIEQYGSDQNTIYILPGSHNKYVFIDETAQFSLQSTTLSGELLNSIITIRL